jgi:hypothetical protein
MNLIQHKFNGFVSVRIASANDNPEHMYQNLILLMMRKGVTLRKFYKKMSFEIQCCVAW